MGISWQELIVLLVIVLVIFGPKRLPEVGKSLGSSIREFKASMAGAASPEAQPAPVVVEAAPVTEQTPPPADR